MSITVLERNIQNAIGNPPECRICHAKMKKKDILKSPTECHVYFKCPLCGFSKPVIITHKHGDR